VIIDLVAIRTAQPDDALAAATVVCAARDTWASWAGDALEPQTPAGELNDWATRIADPRKTTQVAVDRHGIIGVISYNAEADSSPPHSGGAHSGHLSMLFVLPECHGQGVADQLHDHMCADLSARGFDSIRLRVPAGAAQARRFYERHGWRETGWSTPMAGLLRVEYRRALV
jgi:ribosomal protein S18 acetylase RimI-like enzyme